MEKKRINPFFLEQLPRVAKYLPSTDLQNLLLANKKVAKKLLPTLDASKEQYFNSTYKEFVKKQKKKIYGIESFFNNQHLKKMVATENFKEIDSSSIYGEEALMKKNINPNLRNTDTNKIYKFGEHFYLITKRCLVDDSMNIKALNSKGKLSAIPEKMKYDKMIQEVSKDFTDYESNLNRNVLLEKHKRLQKKINSNAQKTSQNAKNQYKKSLQNTLRLQHVGILLSTYGDFALAAFNVQTGKELFHTSDHKYVVRKKNGTKQSKKDKTKKIKSVGSQIRRANEKKHLINIENLVKKHLKEIQKCDVVFVSAPGDNLLELKAIFEKVDVSGVCFRQLTETVAKAKYTELLKVKQVLFKATIVTI